MGCLMTGVRPVTGKGNGDSARRMGACIPGC